MLLGHVNCLHAAHILRKSLPPTTFCISIQVCLHNFQHLYSRCSHSTYSQASFTTICTHTAHTGNRLSIVACKVKLLFTICAWCTVALVFSPAKNIQKCIPYNYIDSIYIYTHIISINNYIFKKSGINNYDNIQSRIQFA